MPLTIDTVASRLKDLTAAAHLDAEAALQHYLAGIDSVDAYAALLRTFYGFFSPVQLAISHYIGPGLLEDIHERRSAAAILEDLRSLGDDTPLSYCTLLPRIDSTEAAFGALYVLEGSTLGGRYIARMLQKKAVLPLQGGGLRFFEGYGEATGARWKFFIDVLNRQEGSDGMVAAAIKTFACLQAWIHHTLHHES